MDRTLRSTLAAIAAFAASLALHAAPLAYVPNEGSATVSVIDTSTDRIVATIATGPKPRGVAVSLDGKRL